MKRFLVTIALVVGIFVAAACGGSSSSGAGSEAVARPANYSGTALGSSSGAPLKGAPNQGTGGTATNPSGDVVPPIQGPQVIRQAQLAISVKSGSLGSSVQAVRTRGEPRQGCI